MTMIGPLRIALAAAALALLSGCAGLGLEDAKMTAPQGNAHDGALQAGYLELAQAEYDEGDYRDSDTFAERSIRAARSEEHTSELQSLMRISYAVFCLKKKKQ